MSPKQEAALRCLQRFVRERGGDVDDIRLELGQGLIVASYRWTAPDDRVAVMGWAEATDELARAERTALQSPPQKA